MREVSLPSGTARRKWTPTAIRSAGTKVATKRAPWPVLPDEVSPISAAASTTAPNRAARATRRPRRSRPGRTRQAHSGGGPPHRELEADSVRGGDPSPGSSRRGRLGQTERRQDQGRHHQQNASGSAGLVRSRLDHQPGPGLGGVGVPRSPGFGVGGSVTAPDSGSGSDLGWGRLVGCHPRGTLPLTALVRPAGSGPGRRRRRRRSGGHRTSGDAPAGFRSGPSTICPSRM